MGWESAMEVCVMAIGDECWSNAIVGGCNYGGKLSKNCIAVWMLIS